MTNTEKAKKRLAELTAARETELTEIETSIVKAKDDLQAAAADMEKAQDSCNPAAYTDAKQRRQAAADAVEMFTGRREKISKKGLITGDEYEQITAGILQDIDDRAESARAELYEMTAKMDALAAELDTEFTNADHLMRSILVELYPEGIGRNNTGGAIIKPKETPRSAWTVSQWAKLATGATPYLEMKQQKAAPARAKKTAEPQGAET